MNFAMRRECANVLNGVALSCESIALAIERRDAAAARVLIAGATAELGRVDSRLAAYAGPPTCAGIPEDNGDPCPHCGTDQDQYGSHDPCPFAPESAKPQTSGGGDDVA